jgi:hypothetical protein
VTAVSETNRAKTLPLAACMGIYRSYPSAAQWTISHPARPKFRISAPVLGIDSAFALPVIVLLDFMWGGAEYVTACGVTACGVVITVFIRHTIQKVFEGTEVSVM